MNGRLKTYLAIDELDVLRALAVTVARAVLSTGLVVRVLAQATITVHLGKVEGTVQAAWQVGDVNIESELSVLEVEQLVVLAQYAHQIDT